MGKQKIEDRYGDFMEPSPSSSLLEKAGSSESRPVSGRGRSRSQCTTGLHWLGHVLWSLTVSVLWLSQSPSVSNPTHNASTRLHQYSPLREYHEHHPRIPQVINTSMRYKSEYLEAPSLKTEQAWMNISIGGLVVLTEDEVHLLGYPDTAATFPSSAFVASNPPKSGKREQIYPAVISGSHQLHCLHFLYADHIISSTSFNQTLHAASYSFKQSRPEAYETHHGHCVDYLLQRLMCEFDLNMTPYFWIKDHKAPIPGATLYDKCIDRKALNQWIKSRRPDIRGDFTWQGPPDDAVVLERPP